MLLLLPLCTVAAEAALQPATTAAYGQYIAGLDARLTRQNLSTSAFLWVDGDPARRKSVHDGAIATQQVKTMDVPGGGMIQHWIGAVFFPGATLSRVRQVDQDYADYTKFYGPDITQPKVLQHSGDHYVVSYRILKRQVLTVVLATVHAIDYATAGPGRLTVRSHSTSVRQIEDAGTPLERILPEGAGDGYLWAMNSYWRIEERDGGVYVECEAVTLSRDVPFGMGHLVGPILQSFAEGSLKSTLEAKRRAVTGAR